MKRVVLFLLSVVWLQAAEPGGVTGDQLWIRADRGVTTVGTKVSQAKDQSGNGRHANQLNTTYRPTYQSNVANFNPAFSFSDHFLDVAYASALNGSNLTVFAIVKVDAAAPTSSYKSPWTTRGDYPTRGHVLYSNSERYKYWNGTGNNNDWKRTIGPKTTYNYEVVTTRANQVSSNHIDKKVFLLGRRRALNSNIPFAPNTQNPFRIGKGASESSNGSFPWRGNIAEIIVYNSALSNANRNRVESYLAIKYGLTLDQNNSATVAKNYHDSQGNTIWDGSINGVYNHDIAGLGRDDISVLDQRVSKSVNEQAVVTISTNSDFSSQNVPSARPAFSSNDRSFLIWANDNGGNGWTTAGTPYGTKILERKWKVQKSGNQNSVSLQVDVDDTDFDIDDFNGTLYLVKGSDLSAATPLAMTDDGGGKWHIDNVNFADGDLFSFRIKYPVPILSLTKSSIVLNDPANGTTNPKRIPGATIRYCFTVDNTGDASADHVTVDDNLTGNGRDQLLYQHSGSIVQDINTTCDCAAITATNGTISGRDVTIDMGTITDQTNAPSTARGCGYIEVKIK